MGVRGKNSESQKNISVSREDFRELQYIWVETCQKWKKYFEIAARTLDATFFYAVVEMVENFEQKWKELVALQP